MSLTCKARTFALMLVLVFCHATSAQAGGRPRDLAESSSSRTISSGSRADLSIISRDGHTAFFASGTNLIALDVADPQQRRVIASTELAAPARRLTMLGDLLVATEDANTVQLFASSSNQPLQPISVLRTAAPPMDIARSGNVLLIAEAAAGLEILDLSRPRAERAFLRLGELVNAVEMRSGLAAVSYQDKGVARTALVSIADPSRPQVVRVLLTERSEQASNQTSARQVKSPAPADGPDGGSQTPASSVIRRVRWDNGVWSSNFAVRFDRADDTIADNGAFVAAGQPRYGLRRLICPAPAPIAQRTSDVRVTRVWSGRWQDLTDCMIESWTNEDWSVQTLGISTDGQYPPDEAHIKSLGDPGAPDMFFNDCPAPDPGWKHAPVSFVVADGCILAFCVALDATDSDRQKSMSVCYWDENIDGPGHGELRWKLHDQRGPEAQPGHPRGGGWASSGPWVPPGGVDAQSGKLLQFFVAFADYRANPGSLGGQLFLMRCHRADADQKWTLDPLILLYADEPGVELVPLPGQTNFMHFHCAGLTFPGGGVEGRRMIVTLSVGDGWPNNRLVNISRDDFLQYDDCSDSSQGPRAMTPTEGTYPPDTPVWNGWTTYEDRAGQRARVTFGKDENQGFVAEYLSSPNQIFSVVPGAFAGYDQPPGVTPVYITGGGPAVYGVGASGIVGKSDPQTLLLNRPVASASPTPVSGTVWSDSSIQPVCVVPAPDRNGFLAGGDEHSEWVYRIAISDPAAPIAIKRLAGTPTHAASGYNGEGICLNWLCLFIGSRPSASSPSSALSEYLALVTPSSIGSWAMEGAAQTLCYSPDGVHWGELFAPNYIEFDRAMQSAFFRQRVGDTVSDRVFVGRDDWCGLWSIATPTPATTVLAMPIRISPGGRNALRSSDPKASIPSVEIVDDPSGENACFPVSISSMGARGPYADVPPPPCEGPVMRCQFVDTHRMGTWRIGQDVVASVPPAAKAKLWLYRMPAATSGMPNEFPVNASAKISLFASVINAGSTVPEDCLLQGPLVGGSGSLREAAEDALATSGWVPFSFEVPAGSSCGHGPYALVVKIVSSNNSFNRQDLLVALDFVGYADADGIVELPARPMKWGTEDPARDETLELRFLPARPTSSADPSVEPWTMLTALALATDGPDAKTRHRAADPGDLTLFTLWESPATSLRVCLDREHGLIRMVDQLGHAWEFGGPAEGDDGIPFAQPFMALRGRQMLFGLARFDAGGGVSGYRAWVSIGGTRITYGTTLALAGVAPNRIRIGDQNSQHIDPADYFGFYVDQGHDMNEGEGRVMLETLDFLK